MKTKILFLILFLFGFTFIVNAAEVILGPSTSKTTSSTVTSGGFTIKSSAPIFTRTLTIGSSGQDVVALKKIISLELNSVIDSNSSFTSKTASDVIRLQEKYTGEILTPSGLTSGTGIVGVSTRAKLNQLATQYGITIDVSHNPTSVASDAGNVKVYFSKNLSLGMSGDDISLLKIVLNSDNDTRVITNQTSVDSYYDQATVDAVKKLQEKYIAEILTPSGLTSGTGSVGPATRKKLNYLINNIISPSQSITDNAGSTSTQTTIATRTPTENNDNQIISSTPLILPIPGKPDSIAPTISLKSTPAQVIIGQSTTLLWSATNAVDSCKISSKDSAGNVFNGMIDISGIKSTGIINKKTTYTITCYNKYGIPGIKSISVDVIDPSKIIAPQTVYTHAALISSSSPTTANRGDIVTIYGSGFLTTNDIIFDGLKIDNSLILSQSSTSISFKIPDYKTCLSAYCPTPTVDTTVETGGKKLIQVSNISGFSNDYYFTLPSKIVVIKGVPTITNTKLAVTSISPTSGNRGDIVNLFGSGFSSDSIVLFGGYKVFDPLVISKTNKMISFVVPAFQLGCTDPDYEICPKLPIAGSGTVIETGGGENVYVMNKTTKATTTSVIFTLPSKKITY